MAVFKVLITIISLFVVISCSPSFHSITIDDVETTGVVESNFNSVFENVVKKKCLECHNAQRKPHGVDLSDFESITKSRVFPPLIVPGEPENSSFYVSIIRGRMPKNRAPLSLAETEAIRNWILNGAKKVEPLDDEPLDDEPLDDEPLDDEPLDDEPLDDEPLDDEPLDDEPLDDEPLDDEPF